MNDTKIETKEPEMVRRIAKVMGDSIYGYVDEEATPTTWGICVTAAREAIAAMIPPTEEMVTLITIPIRTQLNKLPKEMELTVKIRSVYRAMIRAALGEYER